MDTHEAKLLDRLKDYYRAKQDMEEAIKDIEEILLLYDFDIDEISHHYPLVQEIYNSDKKNPIERIRTHL